MNRVALILSGLGWEEGSSVFELPFLLSALERRGVIPRPLIPSENIERKNFGKALLGKGIRNLKKELELVLNDDVYTFPELSPKDVDGAIICGGRGALSILTNYEKDDENSIAHPELLTFIRGLIVRHKPIGALGYGAVPLVISFKRAATPILTCGGDARVQAFLEHLGAMVINATADNVVVDEENLIFSTHGIFPQSSIYRASLGITQLVDAMVDASRQQAKQRVRSAQGNTPIKK